MIQAPNFAHMLFSPYIKYAIQLHLFHYFFIIRLKSTVLTEKKYEKSDLFCTTWAHWFKSLPIISDWGSVSAFDPKYFDCPF